MNTQFRRIVTAAGILLAAGIVRMPLEQALAEDLRDQQLLSRPLELETRKKVGQGFWAVSLGGLRTLVATVLNLRAFTHFESKKWEQVAQSYDTIVQLAPRSSYYWDTGHWHMANNAAADFQSNSELPEIRAKAEWRKWVERGTEFLEEGARQNPDDPMIWNRLGMLYTDPFKFVDYDKAAVAYRNAVKTGSSLPYVRRAEIYALARSTYGVDEALPLIRELESDGIRSVPRIRSLRFVLENQANPMVDQDALVLEIFGNKKRAYQNLGDYYLRGEDNYPMNGVAAALRSLESDLGVPSERSIFKLLLELPDR